MIGHAKGQRDPGREKLNRTKLFLRCFWCLLFLSAVLLADTAGAADAGKKGVDGKVRTKTVRVGYVNTLNYEEGGEGEYKRGYGYEYLQKISYLTGWKYEYVYGTFAELLEKLDKGEIDLLGAVPYSRERAEKFYFSKYTQGRENFNLYVHPEQDYIVGTDMSTLVGRSIGVVKGSVASNLLRDWLSERRMECSVFYYGNEDAVLHDLENGAVEMAMLDDMVAADRFLPIVNVGRSDYYFGVTKGRKDLLGELNQALYTIQSADVYYNENVYSKYNTYSSVKNEHLNRSEQIWLTEHNSRIVIGYLDGNLPYVTRDEKTGAVKGTITELVQDLQRKKIYCNMVSFSDGDDLMKALNDGTIDVAFPLYCDFWLAEKNNVIMSDEVMDTSMVMVFREDARDTCMEKIAVAKNNALQYGYVTVYCPETEVVRCDSVPDCLEAVRSGEAASTILTTASINLLRDNPEFSSLSLQELPNRAAVSFYALRQNAQLISLLNKDIQLTRNQMQGLSLSDNSYVHHTTTLREFIKEHAISFIAGLMTVILLLVIFIINHYRVSYKLLRMERSNLVLEKQAYRDGLTGVGNRANYLLTEQAIEKQIQDKNQGDFAILVADLNGLKYVNDTFGHEAGDLLIQNASGLICEIFNHCPVFRIGGDEFVVILAGESFLLRENLLQKLRDASRRAVLQKEQIEAGEVSLASGLAAFTPGVDSTMAEVFERADAAMYENKFEMKNRKQD